MRIVREYTPCRRSSQNGLEVASLLENPSYNPRLKEYIMTSAFNLSSLGNLLTIMTAFFSAFLAATWLGLVFWTVRDIRARSQDRFIHLLAAAIVLVLNLPGLIVYLILRPRQTLNEAYQQTLEEEALLSQIESRPSCPGCAAHTQADWLVCPHCHTRLRKACTRCGHMMELPWQLCPYCATPTPGSQTEASESNGELSRNASI